MQIAYVRLSHRDDIAPLVCRVVRAMRAVRVLGAGLGFPVGVSAPLRLSPPTSDIPLCLDPKFQNVSQDAAKLIRQVTRKIVR